MLKKQYVVTFIVRIALVVIIAVTSAGIASALTPANPVMACNSTGHSGGGC
jgi:hypothetical protein